VTAAPEITVVIPVWDAYVRWLPSALASLDDQGVPVTVIVVDNASTTVVPEVAQATTLRLERRVSVGAARNAGLALVRTPFVCFLDADDQLLPGALARMRDRLAARPSFVASVSACVAWIEGTGAMVRWRWPRPLAYRLCRHRRLFTMVTALRNAYPTTGVLIRTETLRAAGGFADADHEEDWLPAVALAARGHVDLDERPGRRCRVSGRSLYGAGADFATMRANRRELLRALRRDPRTRVFALTAGWALAAVRCRGRRTRPCAPGRPGRGAVSAPRGRRGRSGSAPRRRSEPSGAPATRR
jgi:glycosyltransferase involved in cell wall biosynthesis